MENAETQSPEAANANASADVLVPTQAEAVSAAEPVAPVAPEAPAAPQEAPVAPEVATDTSAASAPAVETPAPAEPDKPVKVRRQGSKKVTNPITAEVTTEPVIEETESPMPTSVTLAAPYAFYDDSGSPDHGKLYSWAAGQVVEDAATIALLVERGAIFKE